MVRLEFKGARGSNAGDDFHEPSPDQSIPAQASPVFEAVRLAPKAGPSAAKHWQRSP
jgi:hypothetical protein